MRAERTAHAVWEGDLASGSGHVSGDTGIFQELPVSWQARTEEPGGRTSPEELLAAAHAACFSMALSNVLAQAGHPPERLETSARCTFERVGDKWQVTTMELEVQGRVPGIEENAFRSAAEDAGKNCPISRALADTVEVTVHPSLATVAV